VLLKVEDEQGNVVLLRAGGVVTGKNGDAIEESAGEMRSRNIAVGFQKLRFEPRGAQLCLTRPACGIEL
jgi:hypothetical protein